MKIKITSLDARLRMNSKFAQYIVKKNDKNVIVKKLLLFAKNYNFYRKSYALNLNQ